MNILGINYAFHDSAACVVRDGQLVAAIEEERLSREKHTQDFPARAIARALDLAGLAPAEIDHVALSVDPGAYQSEKLAYAATLGRGGERFTDYEFTRLQCRHMAFWRWYRDTFGSTDGGPRAHFVDHHQAHALGSYLVSGYPEAAILSIDGWGEWASTWLGVAEGGEVRSLGESLYPHSLGLFYSAATEFCGFKPNYDEGKTMGLAPCGDPERFYPVVRELIEVEAGGRVRIDTGRFALEGVTHGLIDDRLACIFGAPRAPGEPIEARHRDVAAAFQRVLEECVLALATSLRRESAAPHLVIGGGVALNSVANGRVLREAGFDDLYVMPAAGDAGTCIGAAFVAQRDVGSSLERYVHADPYLGTGYDEEAIASALAECKTRYRRLDDIAGATAELLGRGAIIGWFQGRMEFGPRALGNRSILADPSRADMKARINDEVKRREPFRPFAPVVPLEHAREYFDLDVESPFMLKVCQVRESARERIPAVTHVDGSARVQTVRRETNPLLHELLGRVGERTGQPVLLNTSFNTMGEPIVESPADALRCFASSGLDALVIGPYLIDKAQEGTDERRGRVFYG